VDDSKLDVLAERLSAALDDLKEMKGKVDAMHVIGARLSSVEKDVLAVDRKVDIALQKSDAMDNLFMTLKEDVIQPIKDDMIVNKSEIASNRKWWRTVGALVLAIPALTAWAGLTWKPWQSDFDAAKTKRDEQLRKYSEDVGKELQSNDRRLTVLEFRANNADGKSSK
jgi:hypothetical protein